MTHTQKKQHSAVVRISKGNTGCDLVKPHNEKEGEARRERGISERDTEIVSENEVSFAAETVSDDLYSVCLCV